MRKPYIFAVILLTGLFAACTGDHDHDHEGHDHEAETRQESSEHEHGAKGDVVEMTHEAVESAGITTEPVMPGEFREAVKTSGVIENSRGTERMISAPASGIVSFSSGIVAGQSVSTGQPLFSISSKGLEQADPTATLRVDTEAAKLAFERAERLLADNLITRTEYERLRAEYDRARAASSTVGARTASATGVASPIAGFLVDVNVAPGQFVNMGDPLATVATNRRLLLRADVSERHRDFIHLVSGANIRVPGSDRTLSLAAHSPKVLTASATPSATSHFLPVYIEFDNPGGLGSGSVVETWLLGPARADVISVPATALVEEGGFYYVYVKIPDEHEVFRKTEVRLGATDGSRTEITAGLRAGDEVVTQGAARIRMAGMGSAIQGHSHHH